MDSIPSDDAPRNLSPKTTFIYALVDPETNEVRYVGKANDPHRRWIEHCAGTKNPGERSHKAFWIRGLKSRKLKPLLQTLEQVAYEQWQARERYWIEYYRQQGNRLTNLTDGGEGGSGPVSPAARAKISAANKGRKRAPYSEEWRQKLADAGRGRNHTLETLTKMSASAKERTRRPFSEEARRNMSNSHRGFKHSPESVENSAAARRGQKRTPEQRLNMSLGRKQAKALRKNSPDVPTLWD